MSRKNAQVVTNLEQTCRNAVPTTCEQDVFALLVPSLLTTCYKAVELIRLVPSCSNNLLSSCNSTICQHVKLWVTTLWQLDKVTALLQLVDKLAASLLRTLLTSWEIFTSVLSYFLVLWCLNWENNTDWGRGRGREINVFNKLRWSTNDLYNFRCPNNF
jgi:hypothetical protein